MSTSRYCVEEELDHDMFSEMKSLDKKIDMLETMVDNTDKLNRAIFDIIKSVDMNNDDQISKCEFQKILQDFGIGDFDAIDDLFISLDRDKNGRISFQEFRPFFRAQTKIKLKHLKEIREIENRVQQNTKLANVPETNDSSASSDEEVPVPVKEEKKKEKKKESKFGRWKSSKY